MKSSVTLAPDSVPVLSRGRHRSARRGACFMEFASFLAGEPWSDRPSCTDPLLAHLARGVNDLVSDEARARLTMLIPSVVGLVDTTGRMRLTVAVQAGSAALPIASETRQRTIAVALQHLLVVLENTDAAMAMQLGGDIRVALSHAPSADAWAQAFRANVGPRAAADLEAITHTLTSVSLVGISDACIDDADEVLVSLLGATIAACQAIVAPQNLSQTEARAFANV